jgi:hypothetical protein
MQRYDLTRMGPGQFEQMVQALLVAELGSGVQVHGSGPDGGRDASLNGPLNLRTHGRQWDGLTVVQIKHKEEHTGHAADARWLAQQLNRDLARWEWRPRSQRPRQLLVVTNVVLTPAHNGGEEIVERVLEERGPFIGLKAWDVWHADKVFRLLDNHTQVRQRFLGSVVGDVLQLVFDDLTEERQQIEDCICAYLASSFKAERFADIDQAGAADDLKVHLAKVFVDVPNVPLLGGGAITATLIDALNHPARPADREANSAIGRTVLIGAPGQGKSTIGRFLAQIYRAELLDRHCNLRIMPEISDEISQTRHICKEEGIPRPTNLRFPVFISLTRLADELASEKVSSVLAFITLRMGEHVSPSMLHRWLRQYPWLVIFDGLDEVPISANRSSVLAAIDEFTDIAVACSADVALIATSRPQGYSDEFRSYRHQELGRLSISQALRYADRLIGIRHGHGSQRAEEVSARLERAAREPETARLMTNPLQVTILVLLLARIGRAPSERFLLFASFYDIIYAREVEKNTPAAIALDRHRGHVTTLHAFVGLLLQHRSAVAGETESAMTRDEVRDLLIHVLTDEGWRDPELGELVDQLLSAATERLVFLVALTDNRIGFELRSLQEYCASLALLRGTDEQVSQNLTAVACSDYWRNTFLFACGQIFSTTSARRDTIMSLCHNLNDGFIESQPGTSGAMMGSRLSLDLLAEGAPATAPRYQQALTKLAVALLELPYDPAIPQFSLLDSLNSDSRKILDRAVSEILENPDSVARLGGLRFLSARAALGDVAAMEHIRQLWEVADPETRSDYLIGAIQAGDRLLIALTGPHLQSIGPAAARRAIERLRDAEIEEQAFASVEESDVPQPPGWLRPLLSAARHEHLADAHVGRPPLDGRIVAISPQSDTPSAGEIQSSSWLRLCQDVMTSDWSFLTEAAAFAANPTVSSWMRATTAIRSSPSQDVQAWADALPWPLALWWMNGILPLGDKAQAIGAWYSAQGRWRKAEPRHLSTRPRLEPRSAGLPIICEGRKRLQFDGADSTDYLRLADGIVRLPDGHHRQAAATWLLRRLDGTYGAVSASHMAVQVGPHLLGELAKAATSIPLRWIAEICQDPLWDPTLDQIGRLETLEPIAELKARLSHADSLAARWVQRPDATGLARLAIHLPMRSPPLPWSEAACMSEPIRTYGTLLAVWGGSWPKERVNDVVDMLLEPASVTVVAARHWVNLPLSAQSSLLLTQLARKIKRTECETSSRISFLLRTYCAARKAELTEAIDLLS